MNDRNRHLRLIAGTAATAAPPNRLDEIDDDTANALIDNLVQSVIALRARCEEAECRAEAAEDRARQDRRRAMAADSSIYQLRKANAERAAQYPDVGPQWAWLADIWRLVVATYPTPPVSQEAVIRWCSRNKVKSEKHDGKHRVDIASFRAHWEMRGLPPLEWSKLAPE